MTEFVYQVRVGTGYNEQIVKYGGEFDFDTMEFAMAVFTEKYEDYKGEYMRITRTPNLDEDECDDLGIEYEVKTMLEINVST